jgi:hypothetical protein
VPFFHFLPYGFSMVLDGILCPKTALHGTKSEKEKTL